MSTWNAVGHTQCAIACLVASFVISDTAAHTAEKQIEISGRVVAPNNDPIVGVALTPWGRGSLLRAGSKSEQGGEFRSDENGNFVLVLSTCQKDQDAVPDEQLATVIEEIKKVGRPSVVTPQETERLSVVIDTLIRQLILNLEDTQRAEWQNIAAVLAAHGGKKAVSLLEDEFDTAHHTIQGRIVDTLVSVMTHPEQTDSQQAAEDALQELGRDVVPYLLSNDKLDPSNASDEAAQKQCWRIAQVLSKIVDQDGVKAADRRKVIECFEQVRELDGTSDEKAKLAATIGELRKAQIWHHVWMSLIVFTGYVGLCLTTLHLIYCYYPIAILKANRFRFLKWVFLAKVYEHQDGVLDAWVAEHVESVREEFDKLPTVEDRRIHVPTPVDFDGSTVPELSPKLLLERKTFSHKPTRLLLLADGGSGKTSLACQIAKWAMSASKAENLCGHRVIPVLVDQELDRSFEDTIRNKLGDLIGGEEVSRPLFKHLLKRQRLLVILDRFSEMSDETQQKMKEVLPVETGFTVGSLLVTSRTELDGFEWTVIKPLFVKGNRLSSFMEGYLTQRQDGEGQPTRKLFDDAEFFDLCRRLSLMVGEREITALFGKLYAEQVISAKSKHHGTIIGGPDSIPSLMKAHLQGLCKERPNQRFRIDEVQRASQEVAAVCLHKTFRPGTVFWRDALNALHNNEELLRYLVDDRESQSERSPTSPSSSEAGSGANLGLIQRVGENRDRVRFILDPMAEYLAGLQVVDENRDAETKWGYFVQKAREMDPHRSHQTKGFLLAVRDCCFAAEVEVPGHVPNELAELAGLDVQEIEQHQREQRLRRNVSNLDLPEAEERIAAAQALGSMGAEAAEAVPALIRSLQDKDPRVQAASADALGKIGTDARETVPELGRLLEDGKHGERDDGVLRMAVNALGEFGGRSKDFIPQLKTILHNSDKNKDLRQTAAIALGRIGREATEVISELIKALADDDWHVGQSAAKALANIGTAAVEDLKTEVEKSDDELVRLRAAEALAEIGPLAKDAVPALLHALEADDWSVRKSAAFALGCIGPTDGDDQKTIECPQDDLG